MTHKSSAAWCVIPAAGVGARLGGGTPKQYQLLGNSAVLTLAVKAFLDLEIIRGVVVGIATGDENWTKLPIAPAEKVSVYEGGGHPNNTPATASRQI